MTDDPTTHPYLCRALRGEDETPYGVETAAGIVAEFIRAEFNARSTDAEGSIETTQTDEDEKGTTFGLRVNSNYFTVTVVKGRRND